MSNSFARVENKFEFSKEIAFTVNGIILSYDNIHIGSAYFFLKKWEKYIKF